MTPEEQFAEIRATLSTLTKLHLDTEQKAEEWREEWSERAIAADERAAHAEERHNREMEAIRAELRRAVALSIREARAERSKRQKLEQTFDDKITQLAAAQLVTEEKLQRLLESRSGNGKPQP
jgi:hypothetical protein